MKPFAAIIFLTCFGCAGQANESVLEMHILNDSLQMFMHDPELTVSIKCGNRSNQNLLLYGFDSNLIKPRETLKEFCNVTHLGAGIALFVYSNEGRQVFATFYIPDELKNRPIPTDTFENRMTRLKAEYLSGTRVLKAFESQSDDRILNLKDFDLQKGDYTLQVVYFSGEVLQKLTVGKSQVEGDRLKFNAELYQGCAISNRITFRVD